MRWNRGNALVAIWLEGIFLFSGFKIELNEVAAVRRSRTWGGTAIDSSSRHLA